MTKFIEIKGARANNLQNIDVLIPHQQLTVITGVSGSGKTSLAFDTLYAEGQRRYVESMSAYARQFLGRLNKPEMDYIKGLSPAIAIQQKVISSNPRSTVGTTTDIYDYLKILFAREGQTFSPISGEIVKKQVVQDVLKFILTLPESTPFALMCPLQIHPNKTLFEELQFIEKEGYTRIYLNNKFILISEINDTISSDDTAYIVIDRMVIKSFDETDLSRLTDSINHTFTKGIGNCMVFNIADNQTHGFSSRFELDGLTFIEPSVNLFAFNNPFGACKTCEGFGSVLGIDPLLVVPDNNLSLYEGAIHAWRGETMKEYLEAFINQSSSIKFPIHRPYKELSPEQLKLLWHGGPQIHGLYKFFKFIESQTYKIQYRVMLSRYRGKTICTECHGTRLRGDAAYVKLNGKCIQDVVLMSIEEAHSFFEELDAAPNKNKVRQRLIPEIKSRLGFLKDVGLGYLTLNRTSNSLSGGESQRIHLASSLGSSLVGSTYVIDEPSTGLHPRDTQRLIKILKQLTEKGNTVVTVEHEEEIIKSADYIIDIGPLAGQHGGHVVFQGSYPELIKQEDSLTGPYITEEKTIPIPNKKKILDRHINLKNAIINNLKQVNVRLPLNAFVSISGVSGSGKSTLMKDLLFPLMKQVLLDKHHNQYKGSELTGDVQLLKCVELIDQNPIGRSSRSNPITYLKAFDDIRDIFSKQALAKARNYKAGFFSFNVDGGRCEMCEGEGTVTVGMQFMADIQLTCETCKGRRYKMETLDILYRGKHISDILEMTIEEASSFFAQSEDKQEQRIVQTIQPLIDVGLGYLKVGQSSSTMSGGEAQRIKLASFLSKGKSQPSTLFIFDEPTTGLHYYDIEKFLLALYALIKQGHSVFVIEHNLDVIKCSDWVIDLGPEGGDQGGHICFEGTPENLSKSEFGYTSHFLKAKFKALN